MKQSLMFAALSLGLAGCGVGVEADAEQGVPAVASRTDAVSREEYCHTLAFIIDNNWDRASGTERAAMSAAWGTHCRAINQ